MDNAFDPIRILADITEAARGAGALALDFFRSGERTLAVVDHKLGGSPVTEADYAVDRYLEPLLRRALPQASLLSEERADGGERLGARLVFVVDPIDGTRAFIRGDLRWAISIALLSDGEPAVGVLHLPAMNKTFAAARLAGATLNGVPIAVSKRTELTGARIAGPPSLLSSLRAGGLTFEEEPRIPSLAYRIAQVACGAIDASLASTDAHDWDIAAADLILREAGGVLCDVEGGAPAYNAADPRHGVLAAAPVGLIAAMIAALRADDSSQPRRNASH